VFQPSIQALDGQATPDQKRPAAPIDCESEMKDAVDP
jgi:hypothetical protein